MKRRDLLKHAASAGLAVPLAAHAASSTQATTAATSPAGHTQDDLPDGRMVRKAWVARLTRIAEPVLTHLAAGTLKRAMPVEGSADRRAVTHLEAFGRTLAGVAPWLDLPADDTAEGRPRSMRRGGFVSGCAGTSPRSASATSRPAAKGQRPRAPVTARPPPAAGQRSPPEGGHYTFAARGPSRALPPASLRPPA
jgi:hypothetical protein